MTEQLIVVPLSPRGVADASLVHLPAVSRERKTPNGAGIMLEVFHDRLAGNNGIPPYEWPSACGPVGIVYAKGGAFEDSLVCASCTAAVRRTGRVAA